MENIQFAENLIVADAEFLSFYAHSVKSPMEEKLGHSLRDLDLVSWLMYLTLDAGIEEVDKVVQTLLLCSNQDVEMTSCSPSDLKELDGKGCRTPMGEFVFSAVPTEGMVDEEEAFLDLLMIALDSSDVKNLILFPVPTLRDKIMKRVTDFQAQLGKSKEKNVVLFTVNACDSVAGIKCESVLFSIARALGITSEDLKE